MNDTGYDVLRQYFRQRLPVSDQQVAAIEALFEPRQLRRHEVLQPAGEVARFGAFVVRGCLRSFVVDDKGKEHILQFAPEQWWVSDQHSLLQHTPALFAIDAVEDAEVLLFDATFYRKLPHLTPDFPAFFHRLLQNSMHAMQKRLVLTLSASAEERYLDFVQTYPTLALRLPQRMIAGYLGVTPESLSRIRRELAGA
ncbi:Crp/Fnr family transcriptional regulator [Hymenobacter busanensis]|uniref:Crp/Fnr family transcriptional regulator n=1 Tax=Hymenobacter busanensis TaxID=2607656 RepID=A0A7L4ZSL3_9BACT|nr:Crp/Fnr family transcriptional regulator [Hymenobacter busanensis]KAA9327583.1 Crp/Fnr family transcriptional regulator [Hymenobacter busanensis]QHJ06078.1 Crp/Fnr family transcriptional regulator [Hymenobacter busanensis]